MFSSFSTASSVFLQDEVVTNDRWGKDCACKHGGYYNCADRFTPTTIPSHKWEKCQNMDTRSWGYRRNMNLKEVMDLPSIIRVRGHLNHLQLTDFQVFCDDLWLTGFVRTWCMWWHWVVTTCWTLDQQQTAWSLLCSRRGWGGSVLGWRSMGRPSMLPNPGGCRQRRALSPSG